MDYGNVAQIKITNRLEGGKFIPETFEWVGESKIVNFSYYIWFQLMEFYHIPALDRIHTGLVFKLGPFILQIVGEEADNELIFCELISQEQT